MEFTRAKRENPAWFVRPGEQQQPGAYIYYIYYYSRYTYSREPLIITTQNTATKRRAE